MEVCTMCRTSGRLLGLFFLMFVAGLPVSGAITSELTPSTPSPSPIGTVITWTVGAQDSNPGPLWYRFRSRRLDEDFEMIRDFSPSNTLDWTTIQADGTYVIEVTVRNQKTGEMSYASAPYEMDSRVFDNTPVISPTENPLVFIYSAPPCNEGAAMRVYFWNSGGQGQATQYKPCRGASSMNFYLAGMDANAHYEVEHLVFENGWWGMGPTVSLRTGTVPSGVAGRPFPSQTVLHALPSQQMDSILLQGALNSTPFATDLNGNVVWYYSQPLSFFTRPDRGGRFFGIRNSGTDSSGSVLRLFDVAGTTIKETNAGVVNMQLAALGKRQIGVFHHAARRLSNGNIVTLATVEQILTDVQGPGPIDVVGDMIIVMDSNLQVVWTWDAFDYLDVTRTAVLGEKCGACPSHFLAPDGNDWTHGNSVGETPDGNLVFSSRHQDWVIKINYDNGYGDGRVLWRLGKDGDFTFESDADFPWFSHQHDANFLSDNKTMILFDNGNTRKLSDASANSRGQVLTVDEENRTVKAVLAQDLGVFSAAVGSAQKLSNGNYHFDAGFINNNSAISFEVDGTGKIVRAVRAGVLEYRTYRMPDLFSGID